MFCYVVFQILIERFSVLPTNCCKSFYLLTIQLISKNMGNNEEDQHGSPKITVKQFI